MTVVNLAGSVANGVILQSPTLGLRLPTSNAGAPEAATRTFTYTPDLTAGEQTMLTDLMTMLGFGITSNITLAEFQAIKPDLVTVRGFLGLASPTAAQQIAASKATIRIVLALLRS